MKQTGPQLSRAEWAEVAAALADEEVSEIGVSSPAAIFAWLRGLVRRGAPARTADPRRNAVRCFLLATSSRRGTAEELIPPLLSAGFSRRQVEALALLAAPPRSGR